MYRLSTLQLPPCWVTAAEDALPMTEKSFKEQLKPVTVDQPAGAGGARRPDPPVPQPNATKRPERMSQVQGMLDQLADEAAAKLDDPAELEE